MKRPQGTPPTVSPVDFYESHVFPAVFDHLERVFPELGLVRKGRGWTATNAETTKARFGARPDRVVCNRAGGFLVYGGDAVSWLTYHRGGVKPTGADFVEAVKELASLAGVDTSPLERELTPQEAVELEARHRRRDLLEDFVAEAHKALLEAPAAEPARAHLLDRDYTENELEGLPLGYYAHKGTVAALLSNRGYTEDELAASGLLADGRWEGRLVIPWRDAGGRVATVAARDLTGDGPKYLYLPGATKPPAFGLDVARGSYAARAEGLVLVEGLLDVVLLQARGFYNVAALGDASISAERWEALVALGFSSFTLALDNDEAGRAGTEKALENLRKVANVRKVYVIREEALGQAKDPDELVRAKGLEAFRAVLREARPWALHLGDKLLGDVTPKGEDRAKREAVERVLAVAARRDVNALDGEDLLRLTAFRTGYTVEALAEVGLSLRERRELERAEAELRDAARALEADLGKPGADPFTLAAAYGKRLAVVQGRTDDTPPPFNVDGLLRELANTSEGLASGWAALDALGVRFRPKELAVLGARTGHGKTSALVHLLETWLGAKLEGPLVFFSHEEPPELVLCRLLARMADGWTFAEVRDYCRSPLSRDRWPTPKALRDAQERLRAAEDRLVLVHRPGWSASRVAAYAHELAETRGVGAVLVDYLQRLPSEGKADRRDIEVSATGRTLKSLAVDLSVPVVVGAQINREAIPAKYQDNVRDKLKGGGLTAALEYMRAARPDLHQLREGGSEQEADLVLGLMNYAADLRTEADSDHETTRFEVGVLKNRYGRTGQWAALSFLADRGRFTEAPA
jgi:DNA primase catalytic core